MRFVRTSAVLFLIGSFTGLVLAQEKGAKKATRATVYSLVTRGFEKAKLTDEQKAKIKEITDKIQVEVDKIRTDAGLTAEMDKARTEATKKAKDAGKAGKDLQAAGVEGLTDGQKEGYKKVDAEVQKVKKLVFELLTEEQKANLPEEVRKNLSKVAKRKKAA